MKRRLPPRETLFERFLASDATYNGRFITGVTTTGIYCLPSCSAKKPKVENVRFFSDRESARRAGFRACRRCRPDDFYEKRDPELEILEELFDQVREAPEEFADVDALVDASGYSTSKFNTLVREHYHSTPSLLLRRWKIEKAARELLRSKTQIADVAFASGFESLSSFNENFRRVMAMTPGDYRKLAGSHERFQLSFPENYRSEDVIRYAARLGEIAGRSIVRSFKLNGNAVNLQLELGRTRATCTVESERALPLEDVARVHRAALRIVGLASDPEPFESWIARQPSLARLVDGRSGVRNPVTPTEFEALAWSIIGQQVNVSFATALQNDLVTLCARGTQFAHAYPDASDVARLDYADLTSRRFSRSKAEYLIDTARKVASGELPLEKLAAGSATVARRQLVGQRGVGPWSANYVMMRGFGFDDCVPLGDTGLSTGLQLFFGLDHRPDAAETGTLMKRFAPYRTYATLHLWMVKREEQ